MSNVNAIKKVLVIDDNPTIIELIKYAVNLQGACRVVVAHDGIQEVGRVFIERPDCMIINVRTPKDEHGKPGEALFNSKEEVFSKVRGASPGNRYVKIILVQAAHVASASLLVFASGLCACDHVVGLRLRHDRSDRDHLDVSFNFFCVFLHIFS